jgi:hypothetical protein
MVAVGESNNAGGGNTYIYMETDYITIVHHSNKSEPSLGPYIMKIMSGQE